MEKILWHRRESRRKTEKTNIFLQLREAPAYSKMRKSETRNKARRLEKKHLRLIQVWARGSTFKVEKNQTAQIKVIKIL